VQLLKNLPEFCATRRFITVCTRAFHWSISLDKPIQSTTPQPIPLTSELILFTQLLLGLPSGPFPFGFPTNSLYVFRLSSASMKNSLSFRTASDLLKGIQQQEREGNLNRKVLCSDSCFVFFFITKTNTIIRRREEEADNYEESDYSTSQRRWIHIRKIVSENLQKLFHVVGYTCFISRGPELHISAGRMNVGTKDFQSMLLQLMTFEDTTHKISGRITAAWTVNILQS
jgi:hypothetical protein